MAQSNPNIIERHGNTAFGYAADDCNDSDFFIEGSIRLEDGETILSFLVINQKHDAQGNLIKGTVKGSEFFEAMWTNFAASGTKIDVIEGEWTENRILGANRPLNTKRM